MKHIGCAIKDMRKAADLTQEQLANKSGVSRSHIAAIETGKYSPTMKTLTAIAAACGKAVKDFM